MADSSVAPAAVLSGAHYVDALLAPEEYRWNFSAPGTPLTITYGFMTGMPSYSFGYETGPFQAFTAAQRTAVDSAVALYEQICNVDFVFRPDGDNAQIRFGTATLGPEEAAHAYYPSPYSGDAWAGDVWFNLTETYSGSNLQNQSGGSYGYFVTLHEIGHTLGLQHAHDASTPLLNGQDSRQYTVMSYNEHPNSPDIEPQSLLLYDIAALQYLYGANTSYKSGNDNWRWNPGESFIWCIWDGGGTDTLDASNQTRRVILDLNPGTFSSLGSYNGGDAVNNLAIAFDCWIENAIGGGGNDTITGNQLNNRLEGGAGNDIIKGGAGNDTLLGGGGDDIFYSDAGADAFDGGSGFDIADYSVAAGAGVVVNLANPAAGAGDGQGDSFVNIEKIIGTGWNDTFYGDAAANWFVGGNGDDTFFGSGGADTIDGGTGTNTLSYANSTAAVSVNLGLNTFSGGDAEGDRIVGRTDIIGSEPFYPSIQGVIGSAYDDVLTGPGILMGGAGNDTLSGGRLEGGTGDDLYQLGTFGAFIVENVGEGFDEVRASGDVWLTSGAEIEKVTFVGTGNFRGVGNSFAQTIIGGAGNDTIESSGGADVLIGNGGNDSLLGDYGAHSSWAATATIRSTGAAAAATRCSAAMATTFFIIGTIIHRQHSMAARASTRSMSSNSILSWPIPSICRMAGLPASSASSTEPAPTR